MNIDNVFSSCKTVNDYLQVVQKLDRKYCDKVVEYNKNKKINKKEVELDIFFEIFENKPEYLSDLINPEDIKLKKAEIDFLFRYLVEYDCLELTNSAYEKDIDINCKAVAYNLSKNGELELRDGNLELKDGTIINDIEYFFIIREELFKTIIYNICRNNHASFRLSDIGKNLYFMMNNEKIIAKIESLTNDIENRQKKIESNVINISGIMIALFSIIGFNIYSIDKTLSVPAILMMNESILLAISVMFYLIEIVFNKRNEKSKVFPVVILLTVLVLGTSIVYNFREVIMGCFK